MIKTSSVASDIQAPRDGCKKGAQPRWFPGICISDEILYYMYVFDAVPHKWSNNNYWRIKIQSLSSQNLLCFLVIKTQYPNTRQDSAILCFLFTNNKNTREIFFYEKIAALLTGMRSPGPTFIFPSLNSRNALFLSSDSPYTTEPSIYEVILFTCCLGVSVLLPVHLIKRRWLVFARYGINTTNKLLIQSIQCTHVSCWPPTLNSSYPATHI